uniref:Oxidoreductaselike domain containing 1 [Microtus ochrogaster] n=2 Tax=Lepeophtheirus salmonis TaxID=72036 RepID=A0A0K2URP2_LEPSM
MILRTYSCIVSRCFSLSKTLNSLPEAPTTCCMSGCHNCVWLDYAEDVIKHYNDLGLTLSYEKILDDIDAKIDDSMMKSFIKLEIRMKLRKK